MLFRRKYSVDAVVFGSPNGEADYYIQRENGAKHEELRERALSYLYRIVKENAPITFNESDEIAYSRRDAIEEFVGIYEGFVGVGLLHVGLIEGNERPIIEWTTRVKVKKLL